MDESETGISTNRTCRPSHGNLLLEPTMTCDQTSSAVEASASLPIRRTPPLWQGLRQWLRPYLRPLASLQLTVVLFVLSIGLVFLGTLAQKTAGIWTVVDKYFWSWIVIVDGQILIEFGKVFFGLDPKLTAPSWFRFPYPGGKLLGGILFINLLAAHLLRFQLTWKRAGIFILHGGLLLLFVGEAITREYQIEQQMVIREGQTVNYAFDSRNSELAFVHPSGDADQVTVVPSKLLRQAARSGQRIRHPELPVDIAVVQFMVNSDVVPLRGEANALPNPATQGVGLQQIALPRPEVSGVDTDQRVDLPSAYVQLFKKDTDESLGIWLVSAALEPQPLRVDEKPYTIELRYTRYYKPFTLTLLEFRFDRYIGTDIPKNYSSRLMLNDPERGVSREVVIRMNEPLRYRGEAFFQSSFTPDEKGTILQVVRNPGWLLPYISCVLVTLGMLVHFGIYLSTFLVRTFLYPAIASTAESFQATGRQPVVSSASRRAHQEAAPAASAALSTAWWIPWVAVGSAVLYVVAAAWPRSTPPGQIDVRRASSLPVVDGGRLKPLDTVARVNLRLMNHAESLKGNDGRTLSALQVFFEIAAHEPGLDSPAAKLRLFRIENDQLRDFLQLEPREGLRYSLQEMLGKPELRHKYIEAVIRARQRPQNARDLFDAKLLELDHHIQTGFLRIAHGRAPLLLPVGGERGWASTAQLADEIAFEKLTRQHFPNLSREQLPLKSLEDYRSFVARTVPPEQLESWNEYFDRLTADARSEAVQRYPVLQAWEDVLRAYRMGKAEDFIAAVDRFRTFSETQLTSAELTRVRFEAFLNETGLYYHCMVMYALAALAMLAAWIFLVVDPRKGDAVRRAVWWWLLVVFAVHTFTLLSRMYLMERPLVFVTNLYSSAVFIGWAALGLCLILERVYPVGIAGMVGAVLGFVTSIIAHNLAASGDTLEMMQAVLDTNFWLATHVTTVTLGYAATYIAGAIGIAYVILAIFAPTTLLQQPLTFGGGASPRTLEVGRILGQMIYAVVCFATLFSFVGTVLGGIWADQSWGRFWGWDPKENGAVMIVLWNALILHARWSGMVKDRGMALLAIVGNMITTWSWFGTNQLGVGLHAYGFNNKLALGCTVTWAVHGLLLLAGLIPWTRVWQSPALQTALKSHPTR